MNGLDKARQAGMAVLLDACIGRQQFHSVTGFCAALERFAEACRNASLDRETKGLDYSILQSREPASLVLGFASPYGFMIATLLVELDYLVRVVKSAVLRDLITSSGGFHRKARSRKVGRFARSAAVPVGRRDWVQPAVVEELQTTVPLHSSPAPALHDA
jgi:hypothetical protein